MNSTKSIAHKKELMKEVRRLNPAGVNTAPGIFWDVEGALKTVSNSLYATHYFLITYIIFVM